MVTETSTLVLFFIVTGSGVVVCGKIIF